MSRKVLVTLVVLALLVVGSFFAFRAYQNQQAQVTYEHSSDKVVDDFNRYMLSNDLKDAYGLFTTDLQNGYSQAFWQKDLFDQFKGYKGSPKLVSKGPANTPGQPKTYFDTVQAVKYIYRFTLNDVAYHITLVLLNQNSTWRINELSGEYQP